MAYAYPDNIVEMKLFWSGTLGVQWTNTFHWNYIGVVDPITVAEMSALNSAKIGELTDLAELMNHNTVLEKIQYTDMSLVDGGPGPAPADPRTVFPGERFTYVLGVSGATTGDPMPTNVSLECLVRTSSALRRALGRCWLSGFSESDQTTSGRMDGPKVAAIETAMDTLLSVDTDWQPAVVSYVYSSWAQIQAVDAVGNWRTRRTRVA